MPKEIVSKKEYFEVLRFRNAMASFNTYKKFEYQTQIKNETKY